MNLALDENKTQDIVFRDRCKVTEWGHKAIFIGKEVGNFKLVGDWVVGGLTVGNF